MKPILHCELGYFPNPHLNQIYAGFASLHNAGIINLFRNQLLKALGFLMTQEETIREDKDLLVLVNQLLQMPRIDRIIRSGEQDLKDFADKILASDG